MKQTAKDITDLDLQALVDGELSVDQESSIRKAIENNPEKLQRLHRLEKEKEVLKQWWNAFKQEN